MKNILIIGGGIAGVSAAAALAGQARVVLLEAEPHLGTQASGRSAAMFLANYGNSVVRALNRASLAHLEPVLSPRGMMVLGRPQDRDIFEQERAGFGMKALEIAAAAKLFPILDPDAVAYAAYREDVFDLDADRLLQTYAAAARKGGAELKPNSPVRAISRSSAGWQVTAGGAEFQADMIVNAAGAWADAIATQAGVAPLGLKAYRRSMARLPAPAGSDVRRWPFVESAGERWYAKPDAGGWIVSPAEADEMAPFDAWPDDMVLAEGLARYEEMVTEPVTRLEGSWAGLRTFAPDAALVIGEDTAANGFFWLAGQGGYGFQSAPAASRLLADLVLRRKPALAVAVVAALDPKRF